MKVNGTRVRKGVSDVGFDIGSELVSFLKNVVTNYQAKIGTFLTYPQKLQGIKNRLVALSPTSASAQASALINEVDNASATQNSLQSQGLNIIGVINAVKSDPLIVDAINGTYPQYWELDKISRITDFINKAGQAKNDVSNFMDGVDRQTNIINDLDRRTTVLEGGAGIVGTGLNWLKNVPVGVWIGVGFLGIKFFGGKLVKSLKGGRR